MFLAAFPGMLKRNRERHGLRIARAAWVCGVSVRQYRELEAGERDVSPETYEKIATYVGLPPRCFANC